MKIEQHPDGPDLAWFTEAMTGFGLVLGSAVAARGGTEADLVALGEEMERRLAAVRGNRRDGVLPSWGDLRYLLAGLLRMTLEYLEREECR
jgi:hypothetical protein